MSQKGKSVFIGSVALLLFAMLRDIIPFRNMVFFAVACIIFVTVTILSYCIMSKVKVGWSTTAEKAWGVVPIVALIVWIVLFYMNETNTEHSLNKEELIRGYFPFPLWIVLMLIGVTFCLFALRKKKSVKALKIRKTMRAAIALLFTVATSVQFYAPNIFQDIQGGTYHSHAYTNSIINACWLIPYSKNMESLYGHYAILYMPILKLLHRFFHLDYLTGIFIVSAVLAGISILLFIYILDYFAKDDLIFYLAMFAIGEEYFMLMQGGVFLQVHPHRMIFPTALAALSLWEHKTQKKHSLLAICLTTLSFVWSTEVGIVTMLSFALFRWIQQIMDGEALSIRKIVLLLREIAVYVLLPFGLSGIIINGYNLLAGGDILDFREFMFPLISDRGYIDNIELPLPDATHAWAGAAILFLGVVCITLLQVLFPDEKEESRSLKPFWFLLGIMSLGLMLYYINRPVEGCMFIIMFLMLILQASILQKCQNVYLEWKERKQSVFAKPNCFLMLSLRVITTFILFVMAFDSIYSMPKAFKTSTETIWKRKELMEFAEYVYEQIPPDDVSFGEGVPELMSMIDRDTHLHTTEWSYLNMPLDTMEEIRYQLEDEQWFFCSMYSLYYMETYYPGLSDQFILHEVMEYNGAEFGFFRKEQ